MMTNRAKRLRTAARGLRTVILSALVASLTRCSGDKADPHGHADVLDVSAPLDRPAADATVMDVPASGDATTEDLPVDARAADGATCNPPCGAGEVCCTDQHGHFPACRAGSTCTDAGGS